MKISTLKSPKYIALAATLCISTGLSAQGVIHGVVVDEAKNPLVGVNASIMHGRKNVSGTTTDAFGRFSLRCSQHGVCDLNLSYVGYEKYKLKLNLSNNDHIQLDTIVLREVNEELRGVEVIGRQRRDYNSDYSYSSTKIPIKNKDLSAAVSTVTKELIKDRQAFQLADAIKGASSVQQIGYYNHFNIRGITQNAHGQVINGMRTNQIYFSQPIMQNVERIEVIKGPGSITLSSADPGGTINLVTKKPLTENRREVSLTLGSFNTIRGGLDLTGPINQDKTLLYRVNVGVQKAKSFRDLIVNDGVLISPSLSYIPNKNTAINIELSYAENKGKLDRGQPTYSDIKTREDLKRTPISMSMGAATDYYHTTDVIAAVSLSQRLAEGLQFNAQYMKEIWTEDMKEHRTNNAYVKNKAGKTMPNLIQLRYWERTQNWNTDALNAYLTYNWEIGRASNTTLIGYDYNYLHKPKGNGQYEARGVARDGAGQIIYDTYKGVEIERSLGGFFDIAGSGSELKTNNNYVLRPTALSVQKFHNHAAYLQNLTKWGKLHLLLSLRREWIEEKQNADQANESKASHKALLPRIGLSYAIDKEWSLYATYLQGFQPQSQAVENMPTAGIALNYDEGASIHYEPLKSDLLEAGIKADLFNGKLKATLSVFQVKQTNILMKEDDDKISLRGSDRSRGVELEVAGYITPEWQVSAAYSYLDAIITNDKDKSLIGARKEAAPRNNASIWMKYSFAQSTPLKGLSIGAGVQHSGERLTWWERSLMLPAYTVADLVIAYQPVGSSLDFALKVNNVLNSTYWTGGLNKTWIFPGAPRNFMFTTTYRF